jgi:hypothetical protein
MARDLVQLHPWVLVLLLVVVVPLMVVGLQAMVRRLWPEIIEGRHNDVAGFLIAVVGVLYAVTLAFIVIITWEDFSAARDTVSQEAGALRSVVRDSSALPDPAGAQMTLLAVPYGEEVSVGEWKSMNEGKGDDQAFNLITQMFSTLKAADGATPAQQAFLTDALNRLNDVSQNRAKRINTAVEGTPGVLWTAIIVGGVLTMGFALLFGVANERLHYLMIGSLAGIIGLQIFVILVLSFPFAGNVRVSPEPIHRVVVDFGG